MRIHAMIAEDERLAREELAYLLQQEEDIVLCPSAETGEQLLQLLEQYRPDVIFLDIQMPALSGVEAAKKMRQASDASSPVPLIVFTTAFDDYAVEAFELEAVDYLLKPYDEERFKVAIDRVRRWLSHSVTQEETGKVAHVESTAFSRASAAAAATVAKPRTAKVLVNDGKKSIVLAPEEICYAVRVRRTLEIHTSAQVLRCKMTLQELEEKLRGFPFFRSHRGYLVNLDYIQEITPWFNGAYNLTLQDGKQSKIPVSRAAGKRLFRMIEHGN